MIAVYLIILF